MYLFQNKDQCVYAVVQSLSRVQLFATPWTVACQTLLSFTSLWSLLRFLFIELVMLSNRFILCHPLLFLPSIFPSIRVFSSESVLPIRWPKYWNFDICPSNEYSGLISFTIDWFDLLAVQGTLKSLLQHHNSKASILQCPSFLMVPLSHLYMTTEKTVALTIWSLASKAVSLLFNTRSRFVIAFLPKRNRLSVSWLHSCLQRFWSPRR